MQTYVKSKKAAFFSKEGLKNKKAAKHKKKIQKNKEKINLFYGQQPRMIPFYKEITKGVFND